MRADPLKLSSPATYVSTDRNFTTGVSVLFIHLGVTLKSEPPEGLFWLLTSAAFTGICMYRRNTDTHFADAI